MQATAGARVPIDTTLGAGRLQLWAEAQEGGELQDGALFTISEDDPDSPQGRREIARSVASRPEFIVPSGTYYVTAQLGPTAVRQRVAVSTGDTVKRGIVLGVAKLQVAIDVSTGKAELPLLTRVTRIDGGEVREIARGTGRKPEFTLPAGRYRVEAQAGEQNARSPARSKSSPAATFKWPCGSMPARLRCGPSKAPVGSPSPTPFGRSRTARAQWCGGPVNRSRARCLRRGAMSCDRRCARVASKGLWMSLLARCAPSRSGHNRSVGGSC